MDCEISKTRGPAPPDLAVGLETIYHHLPLGLVLEEVTEELFLIRIILAEPSYVTGLFVGHPTEADRESNLDSGVLLSRL